MMEIKEMNAAKARNKRIIDAILRKAERDLPGVLDLVGIYGSFMSGDVHEKSDLDLLIVIRTPEGYALADGMILDDVRIGYDLYCMTWHGLAEEARFRDPNISRLMDAEIVWSAGDEVLQKLEALRDQVRNQQSRPYGAADYEAAAAVLDEAKQACRMLMEQDTLAGAYRWAARALNSLENAVAMLNRHYFRLGGRRRYQELRQLVHIPVDFCEKIEEIASAQSISGIQNGVKGLLDETAGCFEQVQKFYGLQAQDAGENFQGDHDPAQEEEKPAGEKSDAEKPDGRMLDDRVRDDKKPATAENLRGTYEEMYSNWRNKMYLAAETGDRRLSLLTLASLDAMLQEIGEEIDIPDYPVMEIYDPDDLVKNAEGFDRILEEYQKVYEKAGMAVNHFPDVDAWAEAYLEKKD